MIKKVEKFCDKYLTLRNFMIYEIIMLVIGESGVLVSFFYPECLSSEAWHAAFLLWILVSALPIPFILLILMILLVGTIVIIFILGIRWIINHE